jgi:hypothetical protein
MLSDNEKSRQNRDSRKLSVGDGTESQFGAPVNEARRNAAACFRNPNKKEDWHADFTGVTVAEGIEDGQKIWVNVYLREDRKGRKYLRVVLRPQQKGGAVRPEKGATSHDPSGTY